MLAVAALNVATGKCLMYSEVKIAVQICLGAMSGSRVSRSELSNMKKLIVPIVLMFLVCMILNILFGIAVLKTTSMDISTALLSITPGGATDMIFVAADIGADTGMVGVMQSLRMIFSNCVLTIIFVAMIERHDKRSGIQNAHKRTASVAHEQEMKKSVTCFVQRVCIWLLPVADCCSDSLVYPEGRWLVQ